MAYFDLFVVLALLLQNVFHALGSAHYGPATFKRRQNDCQINTQPYEAVLAQDLEVNAVRGMRFLTWKVLMENRIKLGTIKACPKRKMLRGVHECHFPRH